MNHYSTRLRLGCAVLVALLLLGGCSGEGNTNHDGSTGDENFRVALLTSGPINDHGWNQSGYSGLMSIESELGVEVTHVEAADPTSKLDNAKDFAEEGYDLILGHGFEFGTPFKEIAARYPDTVFLTFGGDQYADNLAPVINSGEQGAYVGGYVSALISQTKKIGCLGGQESPVIMKNFRAFELGAKDADPEIEVITSWTGSYDDANLIYESALSMHQDGVDLLYCSANAATSGVYKAAEEAGIYLLGDMGDQSQQAPNNVFASTMINMDKVYVYVASMVKNREFASEKVNGLGYADGVLDFIWNENIIDQLPANIREEAQQVQQKIIDGEIVVPGDVTVE